jgi:DNA-binding NarL/FixJ family response regulator
MVRTAAGSQDHSVPTTHARAPERWADAAAEGGAPRERDAAITVLIADDHELYREGIAAAIAGWHGLQLVGEASDGLAALQEIERLDPDVALVDVRMPGLDGLQLCERLAARQPPCRTRIVLISASFRGEPDEVAQRSGAVSALGKHVSRDEICRVLLAVAV